VNKLSGEQNSPPETGGVAARSTNIAKQPWSAQTGWSVRRTCKGLKIFAGLTTILCFALSRSRFAPVCGSRVAQARQREASIIKVAAHLLMDAASTPPVAEREFCMIQFIHTFIQRPQVPGFFPIVRASTPQ
jgi:hypothetical protein